MTPAMRSHRLQYGSSCSISASQHHPCVLGHNSAPNVICVHAATLDAESHGTDRVHWIFKNKDQGKTAATASLGLVTLWDMEGGLPQIDKFLYSKDNYVVAGSSP